MSMDESNDVIAASEFDQQLVEFSTNWVRFKHEMSQRTTGDMLRNMLDQIQQFIDTGGVILWGILAVTLLLWMLIAERYWFSKLIYPRRVRVWVSEWQARAECSSWYAHRIREAMIAEARDQLNKTVLLIKSLIAICPLFGLLGTVTGMIEVFDVMAIDGTSNARAMASGVSRATIPTMAGMVVALSGLYFGVRLTRIVERETGRLADALKFR